MRRALIWLLVAAVVAGFVATLVLAPFARSLHYWPWLLAPLVAMIMGALILTRVPRNLVGRLLVGLAVSMIGGLFLWSAVAAFGTAEQAAWAEAITSGIGTAGIQLLPLASIRFPDGKPVTPRWRWAEGLVFLTMATGFSAGLLNGGWGGDVSGATSPSPLRAVTSPVGDWLAAAFIPLAIATMAATALSVVVRFRRSGGEQRQQIKLLLVAGVFPFGSMILAGGSFDQTWENVVGAACFLVVPIAIAAAVVRYRLYEIDLVINRTVLFVILAGFITLVYAIVVVGIGQLAGSRLDLGLSIAATAIIAFAFEPVRAQAQQWANRIAYGNRATPYEVLSDLIQRLATTESNQGLFDRIAQRLVDGTGAEQASIWVMEGDRLFRAAWSPPAAEGPTWANWSDLGGQVIPIESGGERLGALAIDKRRGDPISPNEQRLLDDLAGSSASVLKNFRLQGELTARAQELARSRRRLMEVQDLERRRMERDLDEGAQQLVVSLKVKLNVAGRLARTEGVDSLAGLLEGMGNDAREAITQIRSLARGLYPALLEAEGLVAAIRSMVDLAAVPVTVEVDDLGRLPPDLEATVFFCISEAITNAAKHAPGRPVRVRLLRSEAGLVFEVADQGPGFDLATTRPGSGLRNMADRIDAAGGSLQVDSAPGRGTTISGMLPLSAAEAGDSGLLEPALHQ
jgi:signal transduction histidine kinase